VSPETDTEWLKLVQGMFGRSKMSILQGVERARLYLALHNYQPGRLVVSKSIENDFCRSLKEHLHFKTDAICTNLLGFRVEFVDEAPCDWYCTANENDQFVYFEGELLCRTDSMK